MPPGPLMTVEAWSNKSNEMLSTVLAVPRTRLELELIVTVLTGTVWLEFSTSVPG